MCKQTKLTTQLRLPFGEGGRACPLKSWKRGGAIVHLREIIPLMCFIKILIMQLW